jgi:NADPH2:quinone reductase
MKAAVINAFGAPDEIVLQDVAKPAPGPGEVLIQVLAAGVNRLDHYIRAGHIAPALPFPHILGSDAAGEVAELGAGVTGFKVGDRVITTPGYPLDPRQTDQRPVTGASSYGIAGLHIPGLYAQFAVVPEQWLVRDTTGLPPEQVAALPVSLLVAIRAVQIVGEVKPGDRVLVHAGASITGMMAIQVARALGAHVATTVRNEASVTRATDLGAELVIDTSNQDFVEAIAAWTGGRGADVAIDNLGGDTLARTIDAVKPAGIVVAMGFMAGTNVSFDIRSFFFAQKQLRGTLVGDVEDLANWLPLVRDGRVKPVIDSILPLKQAAEAHRRLAANEARGSVVLLPWAE